MGGRVDAAVHELARGRDGLVTRGEVQAFGGSDGLIGQRVASGRWTCVQAGVYLVGVAPPAWRAELLAATLAAGPGSVASHRAAVVLWDLRASAQRRWRSRCPSPPNHCPCGWSSTGPGDR